MKDLFAALGAVPLVLAHGPVGGVLALGLVTVAAASLVVAVFVWWLSRPPTLSSPNGAVPLILISLAATALNMAAAWVWLKTDWTLAGPYGDSSPTWRLLFRLVLPSIVVGGIYVGQRRHALRHGERRRQQGASLW
jgi:peptidoglycan biosynthesis protein MviN/MurJ (putative lipid II flippase)